MKNYPSSGHGYARLNEEGTVSNNLKSIRSNFILKKCVDSSIPNFFLTCPSISHDKSIKNINIIEQEYETTKYTF